MRLNNGKKLHRIQWTKITIPKNVIRREEKLGRNDKQSPIINFLSSNGEEMLESDDDEDYNHEITL